MIAEVLFVFVNSSVQDVALILLSVVSEPFHASCQQSMSFAESGETRTITHILHHVVLSALHLMI